MFKNSGKAIKVIAKVLFAIYIIVGIAAAVAFLVGALYYNSMYKNAFEIEPGGIWNVPVIIAIFIGMIIFTFLFAYLSVIIMYAFGSLVDDVKQIKERLYLMGSPTYVPEEKKAEMKPENTHNMYNNGQLPRNADETNL